MTTRLPMKTTRSLAIALAIGALAWGLTASGEAGATTMLKVGVHDMTQTSQWVVRAEVASVKHVDMRAQGRAIFTDVELEIREVYRGEDVPKRYTLRLIGGKGLDGTQIRIPGMPGFVAGEDVVLFLEKTGMGHIPCGLTQGVWRVSEMNGQTWVRQSSGHAHMLERRADGRLHEAHVEMHTPLKSLGELVWEIYQAQLGPQLISK